MNLADEVLPCVCLMLQTGPTFPDDADINRSNVSMSEIQKILSPPNIAARKTSSEPNLLRHFGLSSGGTDLAPDRNRSLANPSPEAATNTCSLPSARLPLGSHCDGIRDAVWIHAYVRAYKHGRRRTKQLCD